MIKDNGLYDNLIDNKPYILKENNNMSGIYKWVNNVTMESYVGSSTNITKRLRKYYNKNYLKDRLVVYNSRIYKAILDYDYSNFSLVILEYCDKKFLINREQYYIDIIKPEYNICKIAGSMLGFKHSVSTLLKYKNRKSVTACRTIIINLENKSIIEYDSIRAAAKGIGISHTTFLRYKKTNKEIKGLLYHTIIYNIN